VHAKGGEDWRETTSRIISKIIRGRIIVTLAGPVDTAGGLQSLCGARISTLELLQHFAG
jgi:hypothetical protein